LVDKHPEGRVPNRDIEFGVVHMPVPGLGAQIARRAEQLGFAICLFTDSHVLAGDPFSECCLAAKSTSAIRLGTGVTNPVTRAPGVIASAIGTVHIESGGRAILGLARGDSAAAYAGRQPATSAELEACAREVRVYLRDGKLRWLTESGLPPVPIDIACTGPRAIAASARTADRISLAVGAAPDRIRWALDAARRELHDCGRDPESVRFGAYLNVVVDPDRTKARAHARAGVGVVAHFSAMTAQAVGLPDRHRPVMDALRDSYQMAHHGRPDSHQARLLTDEFVDWFAIAGDPGYCVERLQELVDLGIRHVYVIGGAADPSPLSVIEAEGRLAKQVIPHLR
jgi:5,10-methylenetetrahydromethanopterin reductase